jgi:hypothetical protein
MGKVWTAHAGANNQMRLNLAKRSGLVMRLQQIYIIDYCCCGKCESGKKENNTCSFFLPARSMRK